MKMSNEIYNTSGSLSHLKTYHVGAMESAAHRAMRQYKDALLAPYGITGIEWYIIGTVSDAGTTGARITDLAETLGTTQGFLTKTVNLLEAKGILQRKANAKDARSNYVALNPEGIKLVKEIEQMLRTKLRESIYSLISKEELETYIRVMEKFSKIDS